ncbi:gliding motility-associated C-terminal domain-containing protein [Chitinophaga sp. CF118]|uniref:T9SS type B sorting domain-containing protein n=1 Tax=Chitinophaga sp. CF118 TaxID=1884367 RepID=UPI0008E49AD7|nr:gliding motility-associated C-terminal domain-containing protein [Chitinophaga sp. CF118]SFD17648.1 gliding motility-associated C-terminal domain-containing protein [Chitinophaga sp. CF118]
MKRKTSQVLLNFFNRTTCKIIDLPNAKNYFLLVITASLMVINQVSGAQDIGHTDVSQPPVQAPEDTIPLILVNLTSVNIRCSESKDGQIIFSVSGGTPPYSYSIPGYVVQSDSIIKNLDANKYTCRVTDSKGEFIEGIITVQKEWRYCHIFVPSAFSPNGDGLNDIFRVKIQDDISEFHMQVYDRWGHQVFESKDPLKGWNGSVGSVQSLPASYLWAVTYLDNRKQPMKQQGSVTLVR